MLVGGFGFRKGITAHLTTALGAGGLCGCSGSDAECMGVLKGSCVGGERRVSVDVLRLRFYILGEVPKDNSRRSHMYANMTALNRRGTGCRVPSPDVIAPILALTTPVMLGGH